MNIYMSPSASHPIQRPSLAPIRIMCQLGWSMERLEEHRDEYECVVQVQVHLMEHHNSSQRWLD